METWEQYLGAASRKVEIADFHSNELKRVLTKVDSRDGLLPPISVQAHFEGVVVSVMAAVDQVAQAINSALSLSLKPDVLVNQSFGELGAILPKVSRWFENPLGVDLRRIRVRIIHYSYSKTAFGLTCQVESAGTDYPGSRELSEYARAAVGYGKELDALRPAISAHLGNPNGTTPAT